MIPQINAISCLLSALSMPACSFFKLLYRVQLVRGNTSLARDWAMFPLSGTAGPPLLLLASQTPLIDAARLSGPNAAAQAANPAMQQAEVTTVPYAECTTLHLVSGSKACGST